MSRKALVVPLALTLAACATAPDPAGPGPTAGPGPSSVSTDPMPISPGAGYAPASSGTAAAPMGSAPAPAPPARSSPTAAGWAVSIIGTPFALAFKTVFCGASLVVAAPVAGFLALGVDPSGEGYQALGDGLAQNCGPPYVVSPYAGS